MYHMYMYMHYIYILYTTYIHVVIYAYTEHNYILRAIWVGPAFDQRPGGFRPRARRLEDSAAEAAELAVGDLAASSQALLSLRTRWILRAPLKGDMDIGIDIDMRCC